MGVYRKYQFSCKRNGCHDRIFYVGQLRHYHWDGSLHACCPKNQNEIQSKGQDGVASGTFRVAELRERDYFTANDFYFYFFNDWLYENDGHHRVVPAIDGHDWKSWSILRSFLYLRSCHEPGGYLLCC